MFQVQAAKGRTRLWFHLGKVEKESKSWSCSWEKISGQGPAGRICKGRAGRTSGQNKAAKGDLGLVEGWSNGKEGRRLQMSSLGS